MAKMKDFYGNNVAEAIGQACAEFSTSQEDLELEILETGSPGIFGLCKKKAHIRAARKKVEKIETPPPPKEPTPVREEQAKPVHKEEPVIRQKPVEPVEQTSEDAAAPAATEQKPVSEPAGSAQAEATDSGEERRVMPSQEVIDSIQADLEKMLSLMGMGSEVRVNIGDYMVECSIHGEHGEQIIGDEGRTLDSLQYLLRKMVNQRLPERMPLSLDADNFRERRVAELQERALELAQQVKESGKTRAIPALNPSERRVVHMTLQDDKTVRSRSVGEGLFKKVLIYKPGKSRGKQTSRKRRSRQGGNNADQ